VALELLFCGQVALGCRKPDKRKPRKKKQTGAIFW